MALTNAQYDSLMRVYARRRAESAQELDARRKAFFEAYPEFPRLQEEISSNAAKRAKARILNDTALLAGLEEEYEDILDRRAAFFLKNNLSEEMLEPRFVCPDCRDTGFTDGHKCHCFIRAEIALLYHESNLSSVLERENFDRIDWSLYDTDVPPGQKRSQRDRMRDVVRRLKDFVDHFDSRFENLLFMGPPGLGKAFFSNCIARELLNTMHSVVYFSAGTLFERFSRTKASFDETQYRQDDAYLYDSDLLIIDDLGTEFANAYTSSRFFSVINERLLREKSTIISTNLTRNQLLDGYGERAASRILSAYDHIQLSGGDLRIRLKLRAMNGAEGSSADAF
ncbi:MAG: ATP-binding protein [Lachnospiraceae bacterium]|nr:ATP-binding protein [Lachnospiraceae bacterium]